MINRFSNRTLLAGKNTSKLVFACALLLALAACGKDSGDGTVSNTVTLPTDTVLDLYCVDIGIDTNKCVLDDPDNPYAFVSVSNDNKFDLAAAAPSPKARFYLWATALAMGTVGENQLNVARALYQIHDASGSELMKTHALRAYRSLFDNYNGQVTYFGTQDFGLTPNVFYPITVGSLAAADLIDGAPADGGGNTVKFFDDTNAVRNQFLARALMQEWGFFYDEDSKEVFRN